MKITNYGEKKTRRPEDFLRSTDRVGTTKVKGKSRTKDYRDVGRVCPYVTGGRSGVKKKGESLETRDLINVNY